MSGHLTFHHQPTMGRPDTESFFFECSSPNLSIMIGDQTNECEYLPDLWKQLSQGKPPIFGGSVSEQTSIDISNIKNVGKVVTLTCIFGQDKIKLDLPFANCQSAFKQAYDAIKK